jgi:DNA-binding transcriptional ArsR family regulator
MQAGIKDISPSELVDRVDERREERIAANIVDASWKILKDDSGRDFKTVPGWASAIPGCDWVDAGIIAVVFRDDRKNPEHEFYMSYESMGKLLGLSKRTAQRHMDKLREMGILKGVERKGGRGALTWHLNAAKIVELLGWSDKH